MVITIWSEFPKPLKGWLKAVAGHHWVAKGIFSLLVYVIVLGLLYYLVKNVDANKVNKSLMLLIYSTVAGIIAIFTFYSLHYLGLL